ncbi:hypothetical protein SAMD00019534_122270 [Acytostelium subglobosum LB1]|uniref:hypothetical protein n=1 Tax=Acytostelium subglobosum LB1 TaxID=1410327 RepID=UPI0006448515|nr:hypothetical protein SAMD00019534_122270 [Acytostelium subglobosum LB1]GAM29051.1 hypothetical protein SAMD00019534_122270 [Acytostelium subglobosum LB1]|eukprot:XP_012748057.1 hypothetical protein SAMD00019534_122270 [Acytostelium subglobosum LB1]
MTATIDFYGCNSPNVAKVFLLLKALNVEFNYHHINWRAGEQYSDKFVKINPNSKIPAIVDHDVQGDPITVFESGNILFYLATKYAKFIPNAQKQPREHNETLNWLFWQMANVGPNFGNWFHFFNYAQEKQHYAIQRFHNELRRLFYVLDRALEQRQFVAGDQFTVADASIFPWARIYGMVPEFTKEEFPNVDRWLSTVRNLSFVQEWEADDKEYNNKYPNQPPTDEQRKFMFLVDGRRQNK